MFFVKQVKSGRTVAYGMGKAFKSALDSVGGSLGAVLIGIQLFESIWPTKQAAELSDEFLKIEDRAKKANDSLWKQYSMHRSKMKEARAKIMDKYGSKSKTEAKKVLQNSKRKASSMNTVTGKTIQAKMDKKIKEMGN